MPLSDQSILDYIAGHPGAGREEIRKTIAPGVSSPTVWRALKKLADENRLEITGKARATGYYLAGSAVIRDYLKMPYNQRKPVAYKKDFLDQYIPNKTYYLADDIRQQLKAAGLPNPPSLPAGTYAKRILEKLLVDLSWASSRMEGNTYDILETERLIRFGQEAQGKHRKEAIMILNHKEAIQYIVDNLDRIDINRRDICNIHALLSNGLLSNPAMTGRLRRMAVGITHSNYMPPDDEFEIEENFNVLIQKATAIADPFEQSFFLLVHVPYLQAFDDINKRTSRILSNVPLLKADLAPMSFVTMNDRDYIDGLIGIYEMNNVSLLREAYSDAYMASAQNYKTLRAELDSPEKAALVYRDFVRQAIRKCVLDWKSFQPDRIREMFTGADIPKADQKQVIDYIGQEFNGLHEGNIIRYRLSPHDLNGINPTKAGDGTR